MTTRIANGGSGSSPGRLRLTVTNTTANDQLGLIAAFRSRNYDPASTAKPIYGAEELYPLDTAALATRSGALGPATNNVIRHSNLASSWTPVLELRKAAGTYLTHRGNYRLWVRVYSPDGTAVKVRSVWDVGDIILPVENDFDLKQIPGASAFYLLDLGELRLDRVPVGSHRWTGQIQAKGTVGGEDVDIDQVFLACFDEGYVKLRAPQLSASASQVTMGPRSGGTFADDATVGTSTWANPSNAAASDDARAIPTTANAITHYLKATNFGFAIPTGATIDGIQVEVERSTTVGTAADSAVRIVKGGTIQSTDRAAAGNWPSVDAYKSYGGSTDLWGTTWTVADINGSTFGFAISASLAATSNARIDHIRITVYYTPSTTLPQDAVLFANQSAELAWNGNFREDSSGTAYGPVSEQIDGLLRLPVAGSENRPVEITVLTSRGDLVSIADAGPDAISLDGMVEPCFLFPPGS